MPTFATAHTFCASRNGSGKSSFLTAVPAKTEMFFLRSLYCTVCGKSRSWQGLSEKKIGGSHVFFRDSNM